MRKMIIFSALVLLCLFSFPRQSIVIYQLEVIQLSDEVVNKLGLKNLYIDKPDLLAFDFRITYDPSMMELLVKIPFITMTFEMGTKQEKDKFSSRPWVSTLVGKPATIYASTDELSLKTGMVKGSGIKIQLTPLNIADEKVATKIVISDPYNPTTFDNELWLTQDFSPICLMTVKTQNSMRYFAVYIRASFLNQLPEENVFMVGSVDELANLFDFSSLKRTSEIYGFLLTNFSMFSGQFSTSIWITESLVLRSEIFLLPLSLMAGIEGSIGEEGLRAGVSFIYDGNFYLALGVSDYSRLSDVLTLFAEFYPFKLLINELKFVTPLWRVGAELEFENFNITLGAYNSGKINFWCDGRIKIKEGFFILIGGEYSLNGEIYLRAGLYIRF
ncbi:MAG: hypothetical protein ACK40Q_01035 [Pseudothermotoga sp.]